MLHKESVFKDRRQIRPSSRRVDLYKIAGQLRGVHGSCWSRESLSGQILWSSKPVSVPLWKIGRVRRIWAPRRCGDMIRGLLASDALDEAEWSRASGGIGSSPSAARAAAVNSKVELRRLRLARRSRRRMAAAGPSGIEASAASGSVVGVGLHTSRSPLVLRC